MRRAAQAAVSAGCLAVAAGCAGLPTRVVSPPSAADQRHVVYVPHVPPVAQRAYQCGPAAVASVFQYWGTPANPDAIGRALAHPGARGVMNFTLAHYVREQGWWTQVIRPDLPELKSWIVRGVPPIVLLRVGPRWMASYHFVVLTGYNDAAGFFYANTGLPKTRAIPYDAVKVRSQDAGRWTLIVCPLDRVQWALDAEQAAALAFQLQRAGRAELAAHWYQQALAQHPNDPTLRFNLGTLYLATGRLTDARAIYTALVREQPGAAAVSNNLAWIALQEGKPADAVRIIEAAFQHGAERRYDILDTEALADCRLKRYKKAETLFREALAAIPPEQPDAQRRVVQHLEACHPAAR